ncbi:hypothetical protein ACOMHN_027128 [Nucella lapillus]
MSISNAMGHINVLRLVIMASTVIIADSLDVIHTTHGDVRGKVTSVLGRQVTVYWGIPYATIPARFQRPERAEGWEGVLEASTPPPSCPEIPDTLNIPLTPPTTTAFEEDCLYLNLWVPSGCEDQADKKGLAVLVWIHGGGLRFGSSTVATYNGQVLAATQCVIVASLNYRLGVLGFLSLGTAAAPGNVGLLDQVLALEWIHRNARNFGGSPQRITLFGESAGALSVAAHMVSPLSKHLFLRAIIQSAPLPHGRGGGSVSRSVASALKLAELMGCPVDDNDAMIRCLSEADSQELGRVTSDLVHFPFFSFGIIVDSYFLQEALSKSFLSTKAQKMNVMMGATRDDGSTVLALFTGKPINQTHKPRMDQTTFYTILKNHVPSLLPDQPQNLKVFAQLLEYLYINSSLPDRRDDYQTALDNILGDLIFFCPQYKIKAFLPADCEMYMYSFEHRSSVSPFPEWMGVVHASELDFVFGRPLDQGQRFSEEERQLSRLMMKAWANFAKFGNPNSEGAPTEWPSLNNATYPYAVFRSPSDVSIAHGWRYRQCVFWNEVYTALLTEPEAPPDGHKHQEL